MAKRAELQGKRFGKLYVEEFAGIKNYGTVWRCRCDCGNYVIVLAEKLNNGRKTSCGCDSNERRSKAKIRDLTGKRFGKLVVTGLDHSDRRSHWKCRCDCGNEKIALSHYLKNGRTNNCGCQTSKKKAKAKTVHGLNGTRIRKVWASMMNRCNNPNCYEYDIYGGRGITVCEEWKKLENFAKWAYSNGYKESAEFGECTIDRIDNNKGYSPDNCRWATAKEQGNNKRNNHFIEYNGKRQTIAQWADELGINRGTLMSRIKNRWPLEKALRKEKYSTHGKIKETGD